ncbi:LamG-like jellyroll fold domain-containing protein [Haloferula sp. BvORR071]|uniref:LamG-like jellyroll fold domain-containing protein n=1 Tax=Haloferula sp. BvORR071 TaxID=1396141 RepID=UPI000550B977|nr:LamG-like jellyroll fold domain-containing protein [Haloferula sp. BvORR071]
MAVTGPTAAQESAFTHDASGDLITKAGAAALAAPQIVGQPVNQVVGLGDVAAFSVVIADTRGVTYQWLYNGGDIVGQTGDSLVLVNVSASQAGLYSVRVTNSVTNVVSNSASLLIDSDEDGLPDTWETAFFGNLAQGATGDFDGDGINNINEYQDGTSPASNAAYRPRLTVLTDGGGVVNVTPLKPSYALGEVVTLTAVANPLQAFRGWSGALASQTSPDTITMTASKAVKAHFIRTPIPTGVVSWWRAENDAVDAIGNNTGTLLNGLGFAPGEVGQAFDFTAANQQVKMDASPTLAVGPGSGLTVEAWIKPADLAERPIAEWNTGSGTGWGAHFWMSTSFSGLGGAGCLYTNLKDINGVDHFMFSPAGLVTPNVWQHVAVTYDRASGTTRLFRNGVVVAAGNLGGFIPQTTTNFYLGHRPGTTTYSFAGQMDEPALYNRALTADEIFSINAGGPAGKDATPYLTSPPQLQDAVINTSYSQQLTSNLGTAPLTYSGGFGALPQGLSLSSTGLISGSPSTAGTYYFGLRVSDAIGRSREQSFSLIVRAPVPPPAGTTAWWRGENNAQDSIGTNHGTVNGATFTTGKVGQAFDFNGTNQYVLVPDSPALHSQTLSVDAWVYPRTVGTFNDSQGGIIFTKDLGSTPGSFASYALFSLGNGGRFSSFMRFTDATSLSLQTSGTYAFNQWYHVAMTWDGNALNMYVNGNLAATVMVPVPKTVSYSSDSAAIGRHSFVARSSDSIIDEVSFNNRAMTATEVAALFNAGAAGRTTAGPIINTPGVLADGYVGQAYSKTLSALRTTGGTTYSVTGSSLPPNLNLSPAGVLSGNPTTAGSYNFTVRLADGSPAFAEQSFTLAIYAPPPPSAGLVSWWRAEGNANDAIGSNHGTLTNGTSFAPGKVGQAFALDGGNDYISIPDSASLQPTSLTLEGWFNFSGGGGNPHLFARTVGTGTADSFVIWLNGPTLRAGVGDAVGGGNGVSVPFTPVAGQWYHIAFTFDNDAQRASLYLDGALIGTNVAAGTVAYDNHPVLLGADIDNGNVGNFFYGRIDEASIYSRALSAAELASIYNAGSAGKTPAGPYFDIAGTLPETILLSPYSQAMTTSRGTAPITFSLVGGALPPGITLNTSSGLLSGPPTTAGNFTFTLRATDAASLSSDQTFTLHVLPLVPPPAGIMGWWRAQNDAQDSIGTNHGTLTNGATFAAGKSGNAFSLDGVDDVVTVPAINAGTRFSVEFWLFPTRSVGYEHLVSNNGGSANYGDLYFRDNHIEYWQGGVQRLGSATSTIPLLSWSHVAMTFEGGMDRLYINGELAAASAIHAETFNNPLAFGYTNSPSNNRFKGRIDEISLYNRALSQGEISAVFAAGSAGKTTSGPYINVAPSLPDGTVDLAYSQAITSLRGTGQVTYSLLSGTLPAGLNLNSIGLLSGTPTASGTSTFVIRALDAAGLSANQTFTLAVYPQFRLPPGAVSWWRAEGNANDSLGTNHGTTVNGATFGSGISSQGFLLDGVDDHVTFPDTPSLRPTSFTIEGWFLFEQATGIQVMIAKPILNSNRDSFAVWLQDGALNAAVMSPGAEGPRLQFPFTPSLGRWYHIAYTFDNATKQQILFLDTTVAAVGIGTISPGCDASPLVIGADRENNNPAFFVKGAVDEVTLYNRPLLANEIASIYQARSAGKRPLFPLEAWKLANLADPDASSTGDLDHDGVAALIEYAFGMSPTVSDAALLPQVSLFNYQDGRRLRVIFPRDPAKNDINIEVEVSGDLGGVGGWTTIASSVHGAPTTGPGYVGGDGAGAGIKQVEVRDIVNVNAASAPHRFVRFRVSQ